MAAEEEDNGERGSRGGGSGKEGRADGKVQRLGTGGGEEARRTWRVEGGRALRAREHREEEAGRG